MEQREYYLNGTPPSHHMHPSNLAPGECFQGVVGDVRLGQGVHGRQEDTRHVQSHVSYSAEEVNERAWAWACHQHAHGFTEDSHLPCPMTTAVSLVDKSGCMWR